MSERSLAGNMWDSVHLWIDESGNLSRIWEVCQKTIDITTRLWLRPRLRVHHRHCGACSWSSSPCVSRATHYKCGLLTRRNSVNHWPGQRTGILLVNDMLKQMLILCQSSSYRVCNGAHPSHSSTIHFRNVVSVWYLYTDSVWPLGSGYFSVVAKIETRKCWVLQTFMMEMWSIWFGKTNLLSRNKIHLEQFSESMMATVRSWFW